MTAPPKMNAPPDGESSGAVVTTSGEESIRTVAGPSDKPATLGRTGRRKVKRYVYRGTVFSAELRAALGRHVLVSDREGADLGRWYEADARLRAELGDQIIITPVDLDDARVALCEVIGMTTNAEPRLHVLVGQLADGAVHVLPAKRARAPRTKPRKSVVMPGMQTLAERVRAVRDRAVAGGGL